MRMGSTFGPRVRKMRRMISIFLHSDISSIFGTLDPPFPVSTRAQIPCSMHSGARPRFAMK
jgi:hypothetical protein